MQYKLSVASILFVRDLRSLVLIAILQVSPMNLVPVSQPLYLVLLLELTHDTTPRSTICKPIACAALYLSDCAYQGIDSERALLSSAAYSLQHMS